MSVTPPDFPERRPIGPRYREAVSLLEQQPEARRHHPALVPIHLLGGARIVDRALELSYYRLAPDLVRYRRGPATAEQLVERFVAEFAPESQGFLDRCYTYALPPAPHPERSGGPRTEPVESTPAYDVPLREATIAFTLQTCEIVARDYARRRFHIDPDDERVPALAFEMLLRSAPPEPSLLPLRRNRRLHYYAAYAPRNSFMAFIAARFWPRELGTPFLTTLRLHEDSVQEELHADCPEQPTSEPEVVESIYTRQVLAAIGDIPAHVTAHLEHHGECGRKCDRARAWIQQAAARVPAWLRPDINPTRDATG